MEVIKKTPEKLILRMPANYSLANAIRRNTDEIPVLAVDEVEIFKNDSALYDEFLAHRIGLIPLKTDSKMGVKTKIKLKLVKSGQGTIYSGDLKGGTKVVYSKIPITLLEKDQEIELVATARLGKGTEHAKYSPGLCYFRHILEVKGKNPNINKIIEKSKGVIKSEKKGDKWLCDLPESDVDEIIKIDKEAIKDSEEILFFIESFGQIEAKDILIKAIDALGNNLSEFEKALK
ncbi:MAG: DNA-directed RNA polymerase subunit D [Nanoarchaeota archaeon]|nr:DNA-directed RNA polymerase subunit D [Nanoarchaeota archaeon]